MIEQRHREGVSRRSVDPTELFYDVIETSFGWMGLLASPAGMLRTTLPQPAPDRCMRLLGPQAESSEHAPERFEALSQRLRRYFGGETSALDGEPVAIDTATAFMRAAWTACRAIPVGQTRTYTWLAAQAGAPKASRAAGQAMARNRLPILVPCHRVVGADGSLRGFGAGASQTDLKRRLLDLESAAASSTRSAWSRPQDKAIRHAVLE